MESGLHLFAKHLANLMNFLEATLLPVFETRVVGFTALLRQVQFAAWMLDAPLQRRYPTLFLLSIIITNICFPNIVLEQYIRVLSVDFIFFFNSINRHGVHQFSLALGGLEEAQEFEQKAERRGNLLGLSQLNYTLNVFWRRVGVIILDRYSDKE
ncbi:hypothetical protein ACJX0J_024148, partial [Zea mays]